MPLSKELLSYQNPRVRDLAWVIGSPPLLALSEVPVFSHAECIRALKDMTLLLGRLERDPDSLEKVLHSGADRRLGAYFENLVKYWLDCSTQYRVLAHRLPIREEGKTLGELDLVVLDRETGETQHWEVAVKFYLGVVDPVTHTIPDHQWFGPSQKDRLDIKCEHLLNHQIPQSQTVAGKRTLNKLGVHVDSHRIFCKGRLFYPYATTKPGWPARVSKSHSYGWWITASHFVRLAESNGRWRVLPKTCWLSELSKSVSYDDPYDSPGEIVERVVNQDHPVCVALMELGVEVERGFVVPDAWATRCFD